MNVETSVQPATTERATAGAYLRRSARFFSGNKPLAAGLGLLLVVGLLALVGPSLVNHDHAKVGAFPARLRPSGDHLLGTQTQGRDVLTVMMLGMPNTLKIGLIAGGVGLAIGVLLGLLAGYFGGIIDNVVRALSDTLIILPGVAILVLVAVSVRSMSVELMAVIVASLAWMYPTRTIRAQVLSLRERGYVNVAKMNGMSGLAIVIQEILPNLLPYIAASFVGAVSGAMLASVGLEALGLGPQNQFTLGMEIYWSRFYGAILRQMWWWWAPPIAIIAFIFVGLLLTSMGMDQIVNVRLRKSS
ncbi:MAG: ABC transporter permease [Chloroflexi bacterium]|nr:ABC transporter permease [Chloroflexota bacterium]